MDPLLAWLLNESGLKAGAYRGSALGRRLPACLRLLGVRSSAQARALLEGNPGCQRRALDAVLIGVTEFFRDKSVFEVLGNQIVPELVRTRDQIRVYSAGCSDGQELYSMGILLDQAGALDRSELLGVDFRKSAVARAREGTYPAEAVAQLPQFARGYFEPRGNCVTVCEHLRRRCHWEVGNIAADTPGPVWDLILCRNVTMYMTESESAAVFVRLRDRLSPGGVLIAGRAERPPPGLRLERIATAVFQYRA